MRNLGVRQLNCPGTARLEAIPGLGRLARIARCRKMCRFSLNTLGC
jgi:hypothetical protein